MNDQRSPLASGMQLRGGDFTIESPLGMGGFGITYRAHDRRLKRIVAVKEFFPQGCVRHAGKLRPSSGWTVEDLNAQRARFLEEGRTLARLRHPGIPIIFDIFEENDTAYLVMEFVEGQTFAQYLAERDLWFLPPIEAVDLIKGAGEALTLMHGAQLLHRDLKPSNIMRRSDGQVMLIDFGASRDFLPEAMHTLTVIFTAGYAPLEQYTRSGTHGPSTDVYSLAATLYHLLTGQKPLEAPRRATGEVLPAPNQVNPAVPLALSNAVMHGLEIVPGQRPATVEAFLRELTASGAAVATPANINNRTVATTPDAHSSIRHPDRQLLEGWWGSLPVPVVSALKVIGWSILGWIAGIALGALVRYLLLSQFAYTSRRATAFWYFQTNLSLLLALWLGRRSYLHEKRLHLRSRGKDSVLDSTKFHHVALSVVWGATMGSLCLALLRGEYLVVTGNLRSSFLVQETLLAFLILWPLLWAGLLTYRFSSENRIPNL